ncbi:MAG: preprotein translocase subunit SecY, partial [Bacteroidota bacterium]
MKLIQTIKNIWRIEELRNRIGYTILFILVYRLGSNVVLPGVDPDQLHMARQAAKSSSGGILDLINTFAGGAFFKASIFGLGIM